MGIGILFISFLGLLLLGMPVAFALGISSVLTIYFTDIIPMGYLAQTLFGSVNSYPLLAVPLFVFSGVLMEYGGLSRRLTDVARAFVGHITGGLAAVSLVATAIFAMLSGSGPATVAAIGGIMIPAMAREGYSLRYSAGLLATGGGVGIIIPPSIPLIIYGVTTNTSVGDLFLAGIVPGFMVVFLLYLVSRHYARKHNYGSNVQRTPWPQRLSRMWHAKWTLFMPVVILGGIYGGIFTPTEAAGIAVAYSIVLTIAYGEFKLSQAPQMLKTTFLISGMILVIIATASVYSRILTIQRVPSLIVGFLIDTLALAPWSIILAFVILLLIFGMFMETIAGIILLAPILVPIVKQIGMDPLHFGIVMIMGSLIGFGTPPVGDNLNVASAISGLSIEQVSLAAIPYVIVLILFMLVVAYVPEISLFLPHLLK